MTPRPRQRRGATRWSVKSPEQDPASLGSESGVVMVEATDFRNGDHLSPAWCRNSPGCQGKGAWQEAARGGGNARDSGHYPPLAPSAHREEADVSSPRIRDVRPSRRRSRNWSFAWPSRTRLGATIESKDLWPTPATRSRRSRHNGPRPIRPVRREVVLFFRISRFPYNHFFFEDHFQ